MSLKPIRQYLRDRLLSLDSNYVEHTDAFNTENIGDLNLDKAFHIFYGQMDASALNYLHTTDIVKATVNLYAKGYRDPIEALDESMDFANKFRLECIKPAFATTGQFIKNVVCRQIVASPINKQNDNSIVVRLEFNITMIFGLSVNLSTDYP